MRLVHAAAGFAEEVPGALEVVAVAQLALAIVGDAVATTRVDDREGIAPQPGALAGDEPVRERARLVEGEAQLDGARWAMDGSPARLRDYQSVPLLLHARDGRPAWTDAL